MDENLEDLKKLINSTDLDLIESRANKFNIFRTLKLSNQELKHSRFLAWLFDPHETHSLGDYPLKEFLKSLPLLEERAPSIFDIDGWELTDTDVFLETDKIDILLVNHSKKFIYVIENKIWTKDHDQQLKRYKNLIDKRFPKYTKVFLYLTPSGERPQDDEMAEEYVCISYKEHIHPLVQKILSRFENNLGNEILMFMKHYQTMIEEDIMDDNKIKELCLKIYRNHKNALDLLFEYKPDLALIISETLQRLIKDQGYELDQSFKTLIRFYPTQFKKYDFLRKGVEWTNSNNILLFEFKNPGDNLSCNLIIGPSKNKKIRDTIYAIAKEKGFVKKALTPKWTTIKTWQFNIEKLSMEDKEQDIYKSLEMQFLEHKADIDNTIKYFCEEFNKLSKDDFRELTESSRR